MYGTSFNLRKFDQQCFDWIVRANPSTIKEYYYTIEGRKIKVVIIRGSNPLLPHHYQTLHILSHNSQAIENKFKDYLIEVSAGVYTFRRENIYGTIRFNVKFHKDETSMNNDLPNPVQVLRNLSFL